MLSLSIHGLMLFYKEGMITEAHKLLDAMTQSGVEPEVSTYTTLMDGDMV